MIVLTPRFLSECRNMNLKVDFSYLRLPPSPMLGIIAISLTSSLVII